MPVAMLQFDLLMRLDTAAVFIQDESVRRTSDREEVLTDFFDTATWEDSIAEFQLPSAMLD
jgi:hypothetical protein